METIFDLGLECLNATYCLSIKARPLSMVRHLGNREYVGCKMCSEGVEV